METKQETKAMVVAKVNGEEILVLGYGEDKLIPIKPLCEIIGITFQGQIDKIKNDEILGSTIRQSLTVGADGKQREMLCLPFKYIFGWLFTINPSNVAPDAKEKVIQYKRECYDVLYRYFTARAEFVELKQAEIDKQLTLVETAKSNFREAKNVLEEAETKLKALRQLTMEDYDLERRQLKIQFTE